MKNRKYLTGAEAVLLALLALALVVWLLFPKAAGARVVLTRGGEELGRYELDKPCQVEVSGANGFTLTLVIEDGAAHVEDSTCPDLICQHHSPISKAGESIVCLPGQVSVSVEGGEVRGPDAYAG